VPQLEAAGSTLCLFADDLVLLAFSHQALQHALDRFSAACDQTGMKISTESALAVFTSGRTTGKTLKRMWCVYSSMLSVKFLKNLLVKR